jgi:hypothetical protein
MESQLNLLFWCVWSERSSQHGVCCMLSTFTLSRSMMMLMIKMWQLARSLHFLFFSSGSRRVVESEKHLQRC